jgi:class 3 adenylate cyclase
VAFLGDRRPASPVYRLIIAVDIEGSTARTDPVKGELRRVIYDLLGHGFEAVAITGNRLEPLADRGDGILALVRSHDEVPKTVLLGRLVPLLAAMLAEYNAQAASPELRMRLRAVVHAGDVNLDSRGYFGEAIDVAIRLLDAAPVKRTLKRAAAPLVLVVSDEIYSAVVRQGYVDADAYCPLVHVRVAGRPHRGWVHVPVAVPAPAAASPSPAGPAPVSRLAGVSGQPGLPATDEQAPDRVAAIAGRTQGTRGRPRGGLRPS